LSRCVFIDLRRRKKDEAVEEFKHVDDAGVADLRSRLRRWSMDNQDALRGVKPSIPEELHNRRADNWKLQFAIADLCSGVDGWGDKARNAAVKIETGSDSRTASAKALAMAYTVFAGIKGDAISSENLIQQMTAAPDSEWAEWGRTGKAISQKQLANLFKRYGIAPEQIRIDGQQVRGYLSTRFIEAWERYL
jgi:Protein of unknown function (DUF3631)